MKSTLVALCVIAAPMTACDDAEDASPTVQERGRKKHCYVGYTASKGGSFTWGVIPSDPYGDPDVPLGPLRELQLETMTQNVGQVFAASFASSEEAGSCSAVCERHRLSWEGEGCVVDGSYELGEAVAVELEDGSVRYDVEVTADVLPGCACEG